MVMLEHLFEEHTCPVGQPQSLQQLDWFSTPALQAPLPQISMIE